MVGHCSAPLLHAGHCWVPRGRVPLLGAIAGCYGLDVVPLLGAIAAVPLLDAIDGCQ